MARYSVNKVILVGNLGRDPEMRYTPSGQPVANFSLATSRGRQDANGNWTDETEWHRIVVWERLAELASQSLHKGSKVYVEGRIQSRKYTDNQGVERTSYDIVANDLTLLDRRTDTESGEWGDTPREATSRPQRPPQQQRRPQPQGEEETFGSEDMDDVPF
jgi:single-strand DNA-binding protein